MSNISSINNFSVKLSQTMQDSTKNLMQDVQRSVDRLDRKKADVAQAGLERVQQQAATAAQLSNQQNKIDTFA